MSRSLIRLAHAAFSPTRIPCRPYSTDLISISDVLKRDHRRLQQCYDQIINAGTNDEKTRWQNQFTWELARHAVGEDLVVYPLVESSVPDGKKRAEQERYMTNIVKLKLEKFQKMQPDEMEFENTIRDLMSTLSEHIADEERDDLPLLEKAITPAESERAARDFERVKKWLPTRSHPLAPDKPPAETLAALLAAPMDKLGDLFRKFPKKGDT